MSNQKEIAVFVGSLRKGSFHLKLAKVFMALAPANLKLKIVEIGHLPFYNEDLEAEAKPDSWIELRKTLEQADGVLFLTPEYNRSTTAALKNALDVGSRPYGANKWNGKPAAVISASIGAQGGFGANHHLRQTLACLNMPTMTQLEAYISFVDKIFDESGAINNEGTKEFLQKFINAYGKWVELILAK